MRTLSPSLLAADFVNLKAQIDLLKKCSIKQLHLDVMDGAFVPSISFGMPVIKSIRKYTDMMLDVHMMVEEPDRYIQDVADAGADLITVHIEGCRHLDRTIKHIKSLGLQAGVSLNPSTPIMLLDEMLPYIDLVLIMSVNPGFGGQSFIPYTAKKISRLADIRENNNLKYDIQVDGGINQETISTVLEAGADNIVAGSFIFNGDIVQNINLLRGIIEEFE